MPLAIRFDEDSLEVANSGVVWGGVWLEINGEGFPELRWNDLAVAVLVEVLIAVQDIEHSAGERRVRFFDGPFWVCFKRDDSGSVSISTSENLAVICGLEEFADVVRQVEDSARELVEVCRIRGWSEQDDVRRLEALLAST